jgi:hypothetical protein
MLVLIFSTTFVSTEQDMMKNYIDIHVKSTLLLSDINETWIFWTDFQKIFQYQISWNSVHWEQNCFIRTFEQTDRQTDIMKQVVTFRNFAKALKKLK